jgi:hypothetical protein
MKMQKCAVPLTSVLKQNIYLAKHSTQQRSVVHLGFQQREDL